MGFDQDIMTEKRTKLILIGAIFIVLISAAVLSFRSPFFDGTQQKEGDLEPNNKEVPQEDLNNKKDSVMEQIKLPQPETKGTTSLEEAISERRSVRNFKREEVTAEELARLLWSAQGITGTKSMKRAAPSAGALYPLEVYAVVRDSSDISPAVYHYLPEEHELEAVAEGDLSEELAEAALKQMFIAEAPLSLVITGDYEVTASKYGDMAEQYVHLEAGHAAQNVLLQAESLGLGAVPVGAFNEDGIKERLNLPERQTPFYIIPIGRSE